MTVLEVFGSDALRSATAGWLFRFSSPRTREQYARAHGRFVEFCRDANLISPAAVERAHVDIWTRLLEEQGLQAATIGWHLSAVSSWFTALLDAGLVDINPVARVRRPKVDKRFGTTPAALTADLIAMLEAAPSVGPDAEALVGLLVELGVRISAACTVMGASILTMPGGGTAVQMTGKGGIKTVRRVSDGLGRTLRRLRDERGAEGALLRSNAGVVMTRDGARNTLRAVERAAGVGHVHPHMIRTWAITETLGMDGVELHDAQDYFDHADPATTQRYNRLRNRKDGLIRDGLLARVSRDVVVR